MSRLGDARVRALPCGQQLLDQAPADLLAILQRLASRFPTASEEPLLCCSACGCLCRPSEICPACRLECVSGVVA